MPLFTSRKTKTAAHAAAPSHVVAPAAAPEAEKPNVAPTYDNKNLQKKASDHLWMHFTRQSVMHENGVPIIVKGDGHMITDIQGKSYIDGLSGLFVVQAGHGRKRLAQAAAKQAEELAFFPIWSYAHPSAIELADRLADYAPGNLNKVFFSTGGGEAVETAFKLAKQYWKKMGKPTKHKVISRAVAYHGTPQGALSITGIPGAKIPFEPLVPGGIKVPNTNFYRAGEMGFTGGTQEEFGVWAADRIEEMINYFAYAYPAPARGEPFSITTDLAASPWNPDARLMRIGLRGYDLPQDSRPAANLVFLVDVSGSMGGGVVAGARAIAAVPPSAQAASPAPNANVLPMTAPCSAALATRMSRRSAVLSSPSR